VAVRAADVRAGGGRRRPHGRGVHARLLPARAGPLRRDHDDEAVARDAEEPQAAEAARPLPGRQRQALLQARRRAAGRAIQAPDRLIIDDRRIGEVYLAADEIRARVRELGAEIARDYEGREPLLVGALKSCVVFLADLSRAIPILHAVDFIELAGFGLDAELGGTSGIRLLKDLDSEIEDRDLILVEDVVDTGLTLRFLCKTFGLRKPRSLAAATLLDRPYRRLVDDLPVRYVGFVVPDELFVGYGFDLEERYRGLPDLHVFRRQ
jgi:hypoxanthine phosphoribosyltransferase